MLTTRLRRITGAAAIVATAACADCTTMRAVRPASSPAAPLFGGVKTGDTVAVEMTDGRHSRFVVQRIEGDELVSVRNERYRRSEMVVLKRRSFSGVKTGILAAGAGAGILLFAIAAAYASLLTPR